MEQLKETILKILQKIDAVYSIVNKIPDDEISGYFRDVDGLFDSRSNMLTKLNEELEKAN